MLDLKTFFADQIDKLKSLWTKPVAFVENDPRLHEDGYWAFEMYTPAYISEHGELKDPIHSCIIEPHGGTWMEVLDKVLDVLEKHYEYNIKEQVYYSVTFPINNPEYAGYGRCLSDELLQQLLLAFPELYEPRHFSEEPKDLFA